MTADVELLPCPFCGSGKTEIRENGRPWLGQRYGDPSSVSVRHWCEPIESQPSRMIERVGRDRAAAIAAWNTRATDANLAALQAENERLRAEVDRLRRLVQERDTMLGKRLCSGTNADGKPRCIVLAEERARAERLAEALALLPDEIVMVEHNPYDGPLMFCCGQRVTLSWHHGLEPTHGKECWYARMRALRDHDKENRA